jgi:hypothetical protein
VYIHVIKGFVELCNYKAKAAYTWTTLRNVSLKVDSVDSVNILNKEYRRIWFSNLTYLNVRLPRYIVQDITNPYAWLPDFVDPEGVCTGNALMDLRCYYNPELGLYKTGTTDCEYTTLGVKDAFAQEFQLSMQKDKLEIQSNARKLRSVKLITPSGVLLEEHKLANSNVFEEQLSYSGVLLCQITFDDGNFVVEKLVVKK